MSLIADDLFPLLTDVQLRVDRVPGTQLVHVDAGRFGVVLTREQARDLGSELLRVAGSARALAQPGARSRAR